MADTEDITCDEVKELLHQESSTSREEGWHFKKKSDLFELWAKNEPHQPLHLVRCSMKFKGIPPKSVTDILNDVESRAIWDKHLTTAEILETHEHYRVVYWYWKMPLGVANRDLVTKMFHVHDESTGVDYFVFKHTTHADKPAVSNLHIRRAEPIVSGLIVHPDPEDPGSTVLTSLLQMDMKGLIPHFIVNAFVERAPKEWHHNLCEYYEKKYKQQQK